MWGKTLYAIVSSKAVDPHPFHDLRNAKMRGMHLKPGYTRSHALVTARR